MLLYRKICPKKYPKASLQVNLSHFYTCMLHLKHLWGSCKFWWVLYVNIQLLSFKTDVKLLKIQKVVNIQFSLNMQLFYNLNLQLWFKTDIQLLKIQKVVYWSKLYILQLYLKFCFKTHIKPIYNSYTTKCFFENSSPGVAVEYLLWLGVE